MWPRYRSIPCGLTLTRPALDDLLQTHYYTCSSTRLMGPAPCVTFSGTHNGLQVHVVWNGKDRDTGVDNVGTVPASLSTYLAVLAFKPDIVISAGTSGGFKAQARGSWGRHEGNITHMLLCVRPPSHSRTLSWTRLRLSIQGLLEMLEKQHCGAADQAFPLSAFRM